MSPSQQLGPYRLIERIGRGGMGEVWKARDTRLDREVAVKVSAEQFSDRFEREARAIAALNHPNICTLHDVGPNYLVMELIDGPTLADRIAEGPIPLEEALAIARQIADALEAAHEKNIVHRDLKPGNIKVRSDGSVKVLDFGLAKAGLPGAEVSHDSPTLVHSPTLVGVILGTAAYMAPEQARGKVVDKRADIWSFGVVLHEMLTGKRTFEGEDLTETLASVVKSDPDLGVIPHKVRRLLAKCLQKDPKKRLRDIGDVWELLDDEDPAPSRSRLGMGRAGWGMGWRVGVAWVVAGLMTVVAASLAFLHFLEKPPEPRTTRFSIAPTQGELPNITTPPAVSPDGTQVVFVATRDGKASLWLRPFDSLVAQPIAGTENGRFPFWSPDGKSIGFFANGKLKRVDVPGGAVTVLADAVDPRGGTWGAAGVIVYAPGPSSGLRQISASGGTPQPATHVDTAKILVQRFPRFLPDGKHFLWVGAVAGEERLYTGSTNSGEQEKELMPAADSFAEYAQGRLLYVKGTTLVARPFDPGRLAFIGEAKPVAEAIRNGQYTSDYMYAVSANGILVYQGGARNVRPVWLDRSGKQIGDPVGEAVDIAGSINIAGSMRLSPDGKNVTTTIRDNTGNFDLWLYDIARGVKTRFTFDPAIDSVPVWSPDGSTVFFRSTRTGLGDIYRKPANGSRNEELVWSDKLQKNPASITRDGRFLAYWTLGDPNTGNDIWILPDPMAPAGTLKPYPFLKTQFNETYPAFSPDGHWMAYQSNESGRAEVYVTPFPGPGGKRQISTSGGGVPYWRADGRELFFDEAGAVMAAEVELKRDSVVAGKVTPLFQLPAGSALSDVARDGQKFLMLMPPPGETIEPLTVVENWAAGLK